MVWYWWIIIAIIAYFVLIAIGGALWPTKEKSLSEKALSGDSSTAFLRAMEAMRNGDHTAAERILTVALKRMPPPNECEGIIAKERFDLGAALLGRLEFEPVFSAI
jgi:hypothetical protein